MTDEQLIAGLRLKIEALEDVLVRASRMAEQEQAEMVQQILREGLQWASEAVL